MMKHEFGELVNDLFSYFQKKVPPERTMGMWYEKCQSIPTECIPDITRYLTDMDELPKNLPGAIHGLSRTGFGEIQTSRPRRTIGPARTKTARTASSC